MDSFDIYPNNCRICLEQPAVLDWNEQIPDFYDTTYKCCYFICTNLDDQVSDVFSQMLCETCASDLRNAHLLIQKALKSHQILQQTFPTNINKVDIDTQHHQQIDPVDFEDVYFEKSTESLIEVQSDISNKSTIGEASMKISKNLKKEHVGKKSKVQNTKVKNHNYFSEDFKNAKALKSHPILQQTFPTNINKVDIDTEYQQIDTVVDFETVFFEHSTKSSIKVQNDINNKSTLNMEASMKISKNLKKEHIGKKSKVQNTKEKNHNKNFPEDFKNVMRISQSRENLNTTIPEKNTGSNARARNKSHIMCPYCSKLIVAENIKLHEETHKANRERTEVCPKCGIKLYNKSSMYCHMLTHKKNREKKYKCEFCEKSYFQRGALTVHQRIHLGQMIPCPICSKEFYRQVDLDRHNVKTHCSASLEHTNKFNRTKYYVECKDCSKSIPSHKWKYHRDTHLKKFQMKCTLCDKHFVTKSSCHKHVKRVHKKPKEDYAKVVLYYGDYIDNRTSHLMIKQTENFKPISEEI